MPMVRESDDASTKKTQIKKKDGDLLVIITNHSGR